jgi:hypothetical protein
MAIARTANTPCRHGIGCPHDLGPAAAHVDGLSAASRLQAFAVSPDEVAASVAAAGVGPVERRRETPEERAAREIRDAAHQRPPQSAPIRGHRPAAAAGPAIPMHLPRPRRWADDTVKEHPWRAMGSALGPKTAEEAPVAAQSESDGQGLPCEFAPAHEPWTCIVHRGLRMRLDVAVCSRAAKDPAPAVQHAEGLPCGTCAHAVVCSLRSTAFDAFNLAAAGRELAPGLRVVYPEPMIECDHHLPSTAVPASPGALASAPAVTAVEAAAAPAKRCMSEAARAAISAGRRAGIEHRRKAAQS